jgi:uncharacterized protein YggE
MPDEEMETKKNYIYVIAICLSIIIAGAIIAYRPQPAEEDESLFKFPAGIPPSLGGMSSVALGEDQVNAIMVSGSGSASAQANQATLTLGAWTEDPVASEAVEDNAALMTSIIDAVKALGIGEDKIKTVQYSVSPNYNWETRTVTGYRVTNMIQIEVDDIDLVGSVIDAAAEAGANSIQGISFGLSDEVAESLAEEAYVQALQNAQGKADLIAETLELEITGVLSVSESVYYPYTPYRSVAEATYDSGAAPTPIIEGSLSVSVSVQVAFSFQ